MHNDAGTGVYELYYNQYSICSLMVLLTLRWKGEPESLEKAVDPLERELDIYDGEQLREEYLAKNWKGQVPCLLGPGSIKSDDSLDITFYLAQVYPRLIPTANSDTITSLLKELHQIWFVSLSFRAEDGRGAEIVERVKRLQNDVQSSSHYKAALQKKLDL